ncbi:MAG: phosphotransferase family protein [Planctomycetota bacterium]|jgi:aminoglycoside phosphotransferase (APT) family kinase protein
MDFIKNSSFPHLSTALQTEAVLPLLQRAIKKTHPNIHIVQGRVGDVKCDGSGQYVLLYHLKLKDEKTNRSQKHLMTAKVLAENEPFPDGPTTEELTRYRQVEKLWIKTPMILLPEQKIVLYPFPNDPDLPWLLDAIDPRSMRRRFNRLKIFDGVKVRKVKIRILGYTPNMRASFLYEILAEDKRTAKTFRWQLIGKTNSFKRPDRLFAGAWALWAAVEERIGLARPVGFMTHPRLTLQEKVRGRRLGALVDSDFFDVVVGETARAIAQFHSLSIPLRTRRKLKDEVSSVQRWSDVLIKVRPDLKSRIELLRENIVSEIENRFSIRAPVHADFHHTNVLVEDSKICLIDLDEMAWGDPCVDIGRFLASLRIPSLRFFGSIDGLARQRELFLQEYLKSRPEDLRSVRLFEAASLLTSAASAFRIQRPDWENEVEIIFREAEDVFGDSRATASVSKSPPQAERSRIAPDERLRWASDPTYIRAVLTPVVAEHYGAELVGCEVGKTKRLRHGHKVKYKLSGWLEDRKWKTSLVGLVLREKGGRVAHSRFCRLRKCLRDSQSVLLLPRPIGFIAEISTAVVEPVEGKPLSSMLGTTQLTEAAEKVARALLSLHAIKTEPDKLYPVEKELGSVHKRLADLKREHPGFCLRANAALCEIEDETEPTAETSPVLFTLRPSQIRIAGDRVGIDDITKLRFSHPYLDAADFLAELLLAGIRADRIPQAESAANRFRSVYLSTRDAVTNGFSAFEAIAVMRLACCELCKDGRERVALRLLDYVERIVSNYA